MRPSGIKHTIKKNEAAYFLTLTVISWADVFTRPVYKDALIKSLKYCAENKGLNIYAYCLMPNHLHMLVNIEDGYVLKDTIRDFKRHTSKEMVQLIHSEPESRREWLLGVFGIAGVLDSKNKSFKFWKNGNHAIEIFSEKFVWQKINYIHKNPVKAKFVRKPEDWIYSSASNYLGEESVLEVHCLLPQLKTYK